MSASDITVVGRVGSPFGVQGWFHVQSFTVPVENLTAYQPWMFAASESGPWREVGALETRRHHKGIVAKLANVSDRDIAGQMRGQWIGVTQTVFGHAADGEYYWHQLIGCRVIGADAVDLGVVDHVLETGAHDVLVVDCRVQDPEQTAASPKLATAGPVPPELLIPFVEQYVVDVDLDKRHIVVSWDPSWS